MESAELERTDEAEAHRARLAPYVDPHLARRAAGVKHPVHDFLFEYYSLRPAQLLQWHAGSTDVALIVAKKPVIESVLRLMRATASREGNLGCFGMHEWAMVYRAAEVTGTRHPAPLRLGGTGTDEVVETHRVQCSHFDAFRFFTPDAVPLNTVAPTSLDRERFEQPACLHGNMDLYKHAFRLRSLIPSDLVADAFELAWEIRILDMRAAPYDMTGTILDPSGELWTPVEVETAEGKRDYADAQRSFAERAAPIRQRLIGECERLLSAAT